MRLFTKLFFVVFLLISHLYTAQAQDFFKGRDLSKISVDGLSDEEIIYYRDQLLNSGLSESASEQLAIQRGMPSAELIKLKARIAKIDRNEKVSASDPVTGRRTMDTAAMHALAPPIDRDTRKSKVFGSSIFANNSMTFEPNLRIATPQNYVLGPDDQLLIDVYGYQEVNYKLVVSPEGTVTIPYVGAIPVAGATVEQATSRVKERMIKNGYASLASGQSKLEINIGRIKSIRITIIGEAERPGTYTLSSLSSIFNALYAAGGITDQGSFRKIELIRNSVVVSRLDAYNFLLRGDLSDNMGLMDQDVIRVPEAAVQVEVTGQVRRPAIFEILPTENMNDLLRFSGGFTNHAYTAAVHVEQLNDKERQLKDVAKSQFDDYKPSRGDVVIVDSILQTYSNRVSIKGAVMRPGAFELTDGLTLSQLIKKADGLREDAFTNRGLLLRTRPNLTTEVIPFQVNEVVQDPLYDIKLQKEDVISIASIFDYRDSYTVTIQGEVRQPGVYKFADNLTLKDLLFQAGGLTDAAAPQQIEIARRINTDTLNQMQNIAEVIEVKSEKDLIIRGSEIKLSPWDIIMIRTKVGYSPQITVRLVGEVAYPGTYVLETKQDRVSDLIKRAGGLTPEAFLEGAYLSRINVSGAVKDANITRIQRMQQNPKDSSTSTALLSDVTNPIVKVGLDLNKILANAGNNEDVLLREGDVLNVSKKTNEVMINGEVMFPTQVVYKDGENLDYYIDKAGGFTDNARKKKVYVLYANGSAGKTRKFLFFKSYPKVKPGSEILVPKTPDRNRQRLSTAELVAITSGLATLATVIITLIRL